MNNLGEQDIDILKAHYWPNLPMGNIIFVRPNPNYEDIKAWCDKTNEDNNILGGSGYELYDADKICDLFDDINHKIEELPDWIKPCSGCSSINLLSQSNFKWGVFYKYDNGDGWSYGVGSFQELVLSNNKKRADIALLSNRTHDFTRIFSINSG